MSNLNYVPSWLDSAMTLLEKLNKCIEKIETIVNTVVSVTKTANDALSLANTNETDITELQNKTTTLETKTTTLETNVAAAKKEAHDAYSLANLANTTANTAQAIANEKQNQRYEHKISATANQGNRIMTFYIYNDSPNKIIDGDTSSIRPDKYELTDVDMNKALWCDMIEINTTAMYLMMGEIIGVYLNNKVPSLVYKGRTECRDNLTETVTAL